MMKWTTLPLLLLSGLAQAAPECPEFKGKFTAAFNLGATHYVGNLRKLGNGTIKYEFLGTPIYDGGVQNTQEIGNVVSISEVADLDVNECRVFLGLSSGNIDMVASWVDDTTLRLIAYRATSGDVWDQGSGTLTKNRL